MTRMVKGCFPFYDDGTPATVVPELPRPPHLTEDHARDVGWVIDRLDGRTRATKKHPSGLCRWLSEPQRPTDMDAAVAEVVRKKSAARREWEDNGARGVYKAPVFRLRNVYTTDVIMADIL
jgi:hypothetical protein